MSSFDIPTIYLPSNETFRNGTYKELFRLTGDSFSEYYHYLYYNQPEPTNSIIAQTNESISSYAILLHHNPTYKSDIGVVIIGAIGLTIFRLILNRLFIPVS